MIVISDITTALVVLYYSCQRSSTFSYCQGLQIIEWNYYITLSGTGVLQHRVRNSYYSDWLCCTILTLVCTYKLLHWSLFLSVQVFYKCTIPRSTMIQRWQDHDVDESCEMMIIKYTDLLAVATTNHYHRIAASERLKLLFIRGWGRLTDCLTRCLVGWVQLNSWRQQNQLNAKCSFAKLYMQSRRRGR